MYAVCAFYIKASVCRREAIKFTFLFAEYVFHFKKICIKSICQSFCKLFCTYFEPPALYSIQPDAAKKKVINYVEKSKGIKATSHEAVKSRNGPAGLHLP